MSLDPVTAVKAVKAGHAGFKFWRRNEIGKKLTRALFPKIMARRDAKKAARRGETVSQPEEVSMNLANEITKSLVRHFGSGTAGAIVGVGVANADDANIFVQVAAGLLIYGLTQGWSIIRKVGRAKAKPAA